MKNQKNPLNSCEEFNDGSITVKNEFNPLSVGILEGVEHSNIVIYNPEFDILKNVVVSIIKEITVKEETVNKFIIVMSGQTPFNWDFNKIQVNPKDTILEYVKFADLSGVYGQILIDASNVPTSIIFDDLNNLDHLNIIMNNSHTFKDNFKSVFILTSSLTVFSKVRSADESLFLALFYQRQKYFNYFSKLNSKTQLVEYKNVESELYLDPSGDKRVINNKFATLSRFINDLRMGNISNDMFTGEMSVLKALGDRLMFLLYNGVYDSKFVLDIVMRDTKFEFIRKHLDHLEHTSNKLLKLMGLIKSFSGTDLAIVFKKSGLINLVCSVLKFYYPHSQVTNDNSVRTKMFLRSNEIGCMNTSFLDVNQYFSSSLSQGHILFFDFMQPRISNKNSMFVTASEREHLLNQVAKEKDLEIKETEKTTVGSNSILTNDIIKEVQIKLYGQSTVSNDLLKQVLTEHKFIVRDFNQKNSLLRLERTHNLSYLGVKLAKALPHAIEVFNLKGHVVNFSIVAENIVFGTLTSFNTFNDPHLIDMPTFVFPKNDVIVLYCINEHKSIKIKIPIACVEKYILMDKQGFIVDIYLCIGRRPKIYIGEAPNHKLQRLKGILKTKERHEFLENIQWNRASLNEVPFIENRSDIKIRINLKNNPDQHKLKEHANNIKFNRNRNNKENEDLNLQQRTLQTSRRIKLYDVIDSLVHVFNRYPGKQLLFSKIQFEKLNTLSTPQIYEIFKDEEFSNYYFIVCLLSQKGRFLNYNLDLEDCEVIKKNVKGAVISLLGRINTRFLDLKKILESVKENTTGIIEDAKLMRHVIVTPLSVIYKLPITFDGNRVLREFDHEKFLRVSLREEDRSSKVKDSTTKNQNLIYNYYRSILCDGLFIGERKYFFLAMTMSQMRLHSAWFITPYFHENLLIGPDYIRNWLGDFSEIKNIGKYAIRLGQALSSTYATINVENFVEINDVERNGHVFSDGIGLISFTAAKEISKILRVNHIPSALQIRFAGFKGVVGVHPLAVEDKSLFRGHKFDEIKSQLLSSFIINRGDNSTEGDTKRTKVDSLSDGSLCLITRPSMKKFISSHRNVEVVTYASCQPCYLNRQYIMLLEGLGIDLSIFLEHHDDFLLSHLSEIYKKPNEYIKKHFGLFPLDFKLNATKIHKKLISAIFNKHIKDFYKKNRILVKKGCVLMGVLDEMAVLEENEVFLKVSRDSVKKIDGFINDGDHYVVVGPVVIMKNPCLHPGDIRTVMAVDKPELRYLEDVLVFNQKGERPLPNMCSGSDLDGDMYTVIWDPSLLPQDSCDPSEYSGSIVLNKEMVSSTDIVNFYIRYIRNYHLGSIAHAHLVHCDEKDIRHDNSIFLAELFNRSIDFPKTGFMATVPEMLIPRKYPDFMEAKFNSYPSLKTVGVLFRRGFDVQITRNIRCECRMCVERAYKLLPKGLKTFLEDSNIFYKDILCSSSSSNKSLEIFNNYKREINCLIDKHGYKLEEMAFLHFTEEEEALEEILIDVKRVFNKYREIIKHSKVDCSELLKLSEECQENISSIPLIFPTPLDLKEMFKFKPFLNHKRLENHFVFNSSITVKYFENKESAVETTCKNEAYVEKALYESLLKNLGESIKNKEVLKDIFDLLNIGKFFHAQSLDLVCLFFNYFLGKLQGESLDKLKACKVLLEISREFYTKASTLPFCHFVNRDILLQSKKKTNDFVYRAADQNKNIFHIKQKFNANNDKIKMIIDNLARSVGTSATLLVLDINFIDKASHIYKLRREVLRPAVSEQGQVRKKVESYSHLVINGMFDVSDELKLEIYEGPRKQTHNGVPLYTPKLLNKGYCDSETYKDNLREFFINIFLGGIPDVVKNNNHLGIFLQLIVTPGKFYFHNVDPISANTILTVDKLKTNTHFYKGENLDRNALRSYFYNYSEVFDGKLRQEYIKKKGITFNQKTYEYIFSFIKENIRYQVYLDKIEDEFKPIRICRNKKLKGKAFFIKDNGTNIPNDIHIELAYEEIIFNGDKNSFTEEEKELFGGSLLVLKNGIFVVNNCLSECKQFRFEINTMINVRNNSLNNKCPLTLSSREVHTPLKDSLTLNNKNTRLAVFSIVTRIYDTKKELKHYMEDFETVWNCYKTYYC